MASVLGGVGEFLWDFRLNERGIKPLAFPYNTSHANQVDDAFELLFGANGNLERYGYDAQTVAHGLHGTVKIRPDAIHLINEGNAGDLVPFGLMPDRLGLGLNARHRTEYGNGSVQNS